MVSLELQGNQADTLDRYLEVTLRDLRVGIAGTHRTARRDAIGQERALLRAVFEKLHDMLD